MNAEKWITYLYLTLGKGKATIAISTYDDNTAEIGVAFCAPLDRFARHIGRVRATERLNTKKEFYVCFERNEDALKTQVRDLFHFILTGNWKSTIDIDAALETSIYELITEKSIEVACDVAPLIMTTNTIPKWAKKAAISHDFYGCGK